MAAKGMYCTYLNDFWVPGSQIQIAERRAKSIYSQNSAKPRRRYRFGEYTCVTFKNSEHQNLGTLVGRA